MSKLIVLLAAGTVTAFVAPLPTYANGSFIRGDVDQDGTVNALVDGLFLLGFAFLPGSPPPPCLDAADVDDNGIVNGLVDVIYLLNSQFIPGSPFPPPPYPEVGLDLTPDSLGCGSVDFETIAKDYSSGAAEQVSIIRDQAAWMEFWAGHTSVFFPAIPLPDVDFTNEMVLIVLRHFTSGGYFITIDSLEPNGSTIEIHYTLGAPLGGCPTTDALTQPHHIIRTPILPGEAAPIETVVDSCP